MIDRTYMSKSSKTDDTMPPAEAPAPDLISVLATQSAELTRLTAEVERLNAVNALMEYAAFPSADDARDAETWIAANPGRPLSDYCPPGGLLVKRLTAEVERLTAALEKAILNCDGCNGTGARIEHDDITGADLWELCPHCAEARAALTQEPRT
jgi:hypothetical protein